MEVVAHLNRREVDVFKPLLNFAAEVVQSPPSPLPRPPTVAASARNAAMPTRWRCATGDDIAARRDGGFGKGGTGWSKLRQCSAGHCLVTTVGTV